MKSGLSQKVLAPILALLALGMVATSVVTSVNAQRPAVEESGHRLQREAKLSVRLIDNWLQARLTDLRLWAREEVLASLLNNQELPVSGHDRAHRFLAIQQTGHPFFENMVGQISVFLVLALLTASFLIAFILFRRQLDHRLRAMLEVIDRIGQGDLGSRVPQFPGWKDEVNDLAASFNQMIDQLETNITQLNREIQKRKDSERMLAYHQENLETIIAERDLALEHEIIGRKQIEERLARAEKLEMIGELAGGVAHDLNNILSGIVTYPDLLLLKIAPENPLTAPLRSIKCSGEKAAAIVQDLLTLFGHSRLAKKTVCLNTIIREFLQGREYRNLLKRHPHIAFNCACGAEISPIQGAPAALEQVLFHLADHAAMMAGQNEEHRIVFTTENRVLAIPLQAYEQIDPGNYAVLTMEYAGRGLTPEHLARIFEPFYIRKKLGLDGSGLGMAVVLGVVKEHGGFIDCMVDEGSGARISLFFPAAATRCVQWPDPSPLQDDNDETP